jgi:molybdate transport system regulatory protein
MSRINVCPPLFSCYNSRMTSSQTVRLRVLLRDTIAFGPGKAALLRAVERTGSISAAARELQMSYRRAWLLIEEMNRCFKQPLVETTTGGAKGGGTRVTDNGHRVLTRYLAMEDRANKAVADDMAYLRSLMVAKPRD